MQAPSVWMPLALTLILAGSGFAGSPNRALKVASLNFDRAVFETEEGKRGAEELSRKLEPKQTELKVLSTEIDKLKQRLKDHAAGTSDSDRTALQTEIDSKQKSLDSSAQKVKEESQAARRQLRDFIVQKMASIVVGIGKQKHLNAILDVSPGAAQDPGKFWPDGLVLWSSGPDIELKEASSTKPETDITDSVVQKYNAAHP
jgi:Skp family chaperone for outer membrane proteins